MTKNRKQQLQEELAQHLTDARDIAAKAEAEGRDFTDDERAQVHEAMEKAKPVKAQLKQLETDESIKAQLADLGDSIGFAPAGDKPDPAGHQDPAKGRTFGQAFVESGEFKAFLAQFPGGRVPDKARINCAPVGFKALITGESSSSAGAFVVPGQSGIVELLGRRPLTVRDIISVRQTESDTVEFVRQLTRVNAAAPVPEASVTNTPESDPTNTAGRKPEGGFTFQRVTTPVTTIAEWVPATRRALSDAAQIRGLIDQELRDDLKEEEEDQVINGDGTGENLTGVLETDGIQEQAFVTDIFVTARKAKTKVQVIGRSTPTAYLINPEDDERIDLARDGEERFYGNGPFGMGPSTLWGLPRVVSEAVPAGTAILGDWRKAVLWDREAASITVSDSHADFFIRNMVAILAEERVAFGVTRPAAFVAIDLGGESS